MLNSKEKIVDVNGRKYRLTKMDARTGSYVAAKIALLCAPLLKGGKVDEAAIGQMLPALNRRDFDELQTILLKTAQAVKGEGIYEPVCKADGSIIDDDLRYDVSTLIAITVNAIMFNVGGFFNEAGLMPAKK